MTNFKTRLGKLEAQAGGARFWQKRLERPMSEWSSAELGEFIAWAARQRDAYDPDALGVMGKMSDEQLEAIASADDETAFNLFCKFLEDYKNDEN